jgi:hypothetical protein
MLKSGERERKIEVERKKMMRDVNVGERGRDVE